ncbi:MAG: DNA glycosylase [Verrucomicrobiia bacterium]
METTVRDFHLGHTLECGQAFRWHRRSDGSYEGVIGRTVVCATQAGDKLVLTGEPEETLAHYFQLHENLAAIVGTFPNDPHMRRAVAFGQGMRLLRQEPWECLASFICSSAKQFVQICQVVDNLCRALGEPFEAGGRAGFAFPSVAAVARATHEQLWSCKMGFRAKNLLAAARLIDSGKVRLETIAAMDYPRAVEELTKLPGVGPKVADCALLFGWGRQEAFPIDVWIERALRRLYFPGKRRVTRRQLVEFHRSYFVPYAGYAQQYLFHYVRNNPQALAAAPR